MLPALNAALALALVVTGACAKSTGQALSLGTAASAHGWAAAHVPAALASVACVVAGCARPATRARVGFRSAVAQVAVLAGVALTLDRGRFGDPRAAAIAHAVGGLAFLALCVRAAGAALVPPVACAAHRAAHRRFSYATSALLASAVAQVVLGAAVRHLGAGLSIPDFPLAMGRLVPPLTSPYVALHFTHRVVGMVVVTLAIGCSGVATVDLHEHVALGRVARVAGALVALQVALGAYVIWWERAVSVTVAHVTNGALAFGLAYWLSAMARES